MPTLTKKILITSIKNSFTNKDKKIIQWLFNI